MYCQVETLFLLLCSNIHILNLESYFKRGIKMKRVSILLLLVFITAVWAMFLIAEDATVQSSSFNVDGWKVRYASPSYGISMLLLNVTANGLDETVAVPGFDFRILNGMNVSKRGGFYTGYEVGATIYVMSESDSFYVDDLNSGSGGNIYLSDFFAGSVYIMQKYGYRLDLGMKAGGLSIGTEIGIGLVVGGGSYDIIDETDSAEDGSGSTDNPFGMLMELSLEGTLRLGQNTRLFAGLGADLSNPMFESVEGSSSANLDIEQAPIRPFLRAGFSMNY